MAFLFGDTFDFYATYADLSLRWNLGVYVPAFISAAGTAFGTGQALQANDINGNALSMQSAFVTTGALGGNEPTIYLSFRLKALPGVSTGQQFHISLLNATAPQIDLQFTGDGSIVVRAGGTGSPPIKTQAGAFVVNTWDSWQVKVFISATTGTIEVRKNGSSTPLFALSNVNTQADTSKASANGLQLYNNTSGTNTPFWALDDLYVNSANDAAPTSWPGDVRGTIVVPNGTVASGFTPTPASAPNYANVADLTPDGDTSYVQSSVIGNEDLYTISPTTAQNIIGVNLFAYLKRTDSGMKTAGLQIKQGATDTSVLVVNPSLSYAWQTIYLAVDPSGTSWTVASVTTMNLGIKVIV